MSRGLCGGRAGQTHPTSGGVAMLRWIYPAFPGTRESLGLLLLRLVMGAAFILHGWPKIQNATAWMGADAPVPGFLQAAAAASEFGGGILLILGLLTPLALLGLAATMAVASHLHYV